MIGNAGTGDGAAENKENVARNIALIRLQWQTAPGHGEKTMKPVEKRSSPKENRVTNEDAQRIIAEKTEAFLKLGGQIQQIPKGATGQTKLMQHGITISKGDTPRS